jgi:hypothetical protein
VHRADVLGLVVAGDDDRDPPRRGQVLSMAMGVANGSISLIGRPKANFG